MRRFILSVALFAVLLPLRSVGQNYSEQLQGANIVYSKEMSGAANINTFGWGGYFRQSKAIDAYKLKFYEVGFSTYRDSKEVTFPALYHGYRSYKFGKLNNVVLLRGAVGMVYNISRKPSWGGVDINLVYAAGASLALAVPVYLYVIDVEMSGGEQYYVETLQRYNPDTHSDVNIIGGAPFYKGTLETKPYLGINAKVGLNFEYGEYNNVVKSLELGGVLDYMPVGVPVMAYNDPRNLFFSFYLSLFFGKRYN